VTGILKRAKKCGLSWEQVQDWNNKELSENLFPSGAVKAAYKMPGYGHVHQLMAKSGVTLGRGCGGWDLWG